MMDLAPAPAASGGSRVQATYKINTCDRIG
jgi:hypothetical protein